MFSIGRFWPKPFSAGGAPLVDPGMGAAPLRVLTICEALIATQEVHLLRPLRRLRREGGCAVAVLSEAFLKDAPGDWLRQAWRAWRPDVLVLSRYAGEDCAKVLEVARAHATPVVTHLDDYLLKVPDDLGADKVRRHNKPERIAAIRLSLEAADLLYISTEPLADKLRRDGFSKPILVSQLQSCADPEELVPVQARPGFCIGYQGTRNHRADLALVAPSIKRLMQARPHVRFELFGSIETPDGFAEFGERVRRHSSIGSYDSFLEKLKTMEWNVGLAPLRDTEFNSFRTDTKWVEYAVAGIPVLASESVVYGAAANAGACLQIAADKWDEALAQAADDPSRLLSLAQTAQDRLKRDLSLAQMEKQVLSMIAAVGVR